MTTAIFVVAFGVVTFLLFVALGSLDDIKDENAALRKRLAKAEGERAAAQHAANVNARWHG